VGIHRYLGKQTMRTTSDDKVLPAGSCAKDAGGAGAITMHPRRMRHVVTLRVLRYLYRYIVVCKHRSVHKITRHHTAGTRQPCAYSSSQPCN
jgi:hypothetical protein